MNLREDSEWILLAKDDKGHMISHFYLPYLSEDQACTTPAIWSITTYSYPHTTI